MAFYCEPRYSDYGAVTCGWRGHGGLLLDESNKIIPQYNLEAAWKRRITPISGFDEGLVLPESGKAAAMLRPPGHLRFDQDAASMLHRNLICARAVDEDSLRIWSINETSQRNTLEESRFKVEGGTVVDWCLKADEEWTLQRTLFPEAVSELRCSTNELFSVLCRGRQSLFAVKPDKTTITLYRGAVWNFEENPHLQEEIAVIGGDGMVWSGAMGESLARTKTEPKENLKLLTYSDHPRVLIVGGEYEIRSLDLRGDVNPTRIFSSPPFSEPLLPKNTSTPTKPLSRQRLTHLKTLPGNLHNLIAITTDSVYLIDDRCPGRHILSNKHAIPGGPSVLLSGTPIPDSDGNGSIQSIYLLDHFCTGVWILELYQHPGEIWSSVRPLHGAGDPDDRKYVPRPSEKEEPGDVFQPTRGIAIVNNFSCGGKPMELLLRAHDDGTVCFKSYFHGQEEELERELKETTLERNTRFARRLKECKEKTAEEIFGEELMQKTERSCKLIDVEISSPSAASFSHQFHLNPLRKQISEQRVVLEPLIPAHADAILSNVVNSYWKNVSDV